MMKEIQLTRDKSAIVDDEDYEFLMQWKWQDNGHGYAVRTCRKNGKRKIWMHRILNKTPDGMHTDHINGDKLDNRKQNLRTVNRAQNGMNRLSYSGSSSKYKGVSWHKRNNSWSASIRVNKKLLHLGYFSCEEDAALAYNFSAIQYFGYFSRLNSA